MAQEAKSPPAGAATEAGDNPFDIKGTSAGDIQDDAAFPTPDAASGADGSLAERLRAEQRKAPERKMDETKPADFG
ncbi:MAG: hypothetical protein WBE50_02985, partial [Methyloceanibacter sp.]